jgi:hypothetical protein
MSEGDPVHKEIVQQASATPRSIDEAPDEPVRGKGLPKDMGPLPVVVSARAYGRTFTKKNGQSSGEVMFRLPWRQISSTHGVRFEEQKLYRVSGAVEGIFDFQAHFFASGHRSIMIHVPVRYLDR